MGCGGSRLGGVAREDEGGVGPIPEGIRPLLRRRLEEMRKRSHARVLKGSHTLSKKELLRHSSSEDGEETEENDASLKSSAKVAPAPLEEKKEVIYETIMSRDDVKEGKNEKENQDGDGDKKEGDDEVVVHDDDEDEGRMSNFDERMICPGSPSFRVYCIDVTSDDDEVKDGEDTRKSMEMESVVIDPKKEGSIVKTEKRERKTKRFGMTLPKKYLANVTAPCYAGRGCMGNTNSRIVQEKSRQ